MEKRVSSFRLSVKATGESGEFEGFGSVFGNVDSYGDIVERGAFNKSLQERGMPALLWQHKADTPIGIYTDAYENDKGLVVKGQLNLETQIGRESYSLLKQGALKGLSIGYVPKVTEYEEDVNIAHLKEVELWEVSLVTFPANTLANVTGVKSACTARMLEEILRDAGFTKREALAIAANGYKGLSAERDAGFNSLLDNLSKLKSNLEGY